MVILSFFAGKVCVFFNELTGDIGDYHFQ